MTCEHKWKIQRYYMANAFEKPSGGKWIWTKYRFRICKKCGAEGADFWRDNKWNFSYNKFMG